ncbi:hypothetical protein CMI37_34240 [Candidatus Pacearchaeota archaeon]|nr:hypothetical protein [Candidatus Pacearchaeota archaeon]
MFPLHADTPLGVIADYFADQGEAEVEVAIKAMAELLQQPSCLGLPAVEMLARMSRAADRDLS